MSDGWDLYLRVIVLYQKDLSGDGAHQTPVTAMDNDFIMIPVNCNGFHLQQKQIIPSVSILM